MYKNTWTFIIENLYNQPQQRVPAEWFQEGNIKKWSRPPGGASDSNTHGETERGLPTEEGNYGTASGLKRSSEPLSSEGYRQSAKGKTWYETDSSTRGARDTPTLHEMPCREDGDGGDPLLCAGLKGDALALTSPSAI